MVSLGDLFKQYQIQDSFDTLFGATPEARNEWIDAAQKVVRIFAEEEGLTAETAKEMPQATQLGPKATIAYEEFISLLRKSGMLFE